MVKKKYRRKMMQVPLSRPDITEKEINAVLSVLNTHYLSLGPKLKEFEESFASYLGMKHAVAVSNGTAGLHLAVRALGIGEGDAVITTPFSFIASANAMLYERAMPIFVDIDPLTLNIDAEKVKEFVENQCKWDRQGSKGALVARRSQGLRLPARHSPKSGTSATRVIKAILPVHVFGHPVDMAPLMEISERYNLPIIEDACEAIGSEYKGQKVGTFGAASVFSFYPNKPITTGEGGLLVTDRDELADSFLQMRNQGRSTMKTAWLEHACLGYNYRMDELSAALGIAQMERIEEILRKREEVAQLYFDTLQDIDEIELPYIAPYATMRWFVFVIRVKEGVDRDGVMGFLREHGVGARPYFTPIHLQPFYREMFGYKEDDFPVTEQVSKRTIAIPFHNNLTEKEIKYVAFKLKEGCQRIMVTD